MKLNNFFNKPKHVPLSSPKFVLQNDAARFKYEGQIKELETQIALYKDIEGQRDEMRKRLVREQETFKESQKELSSLAQQLLDAQHLIEYNNNQLSKIPTLEEEGKNTRSKYVNLNNEFQNLTKTAFEQSNNLSVLGQQFEAVQSENKNLTVETKRATASELSMLEEYTGIKNDNANLKNFTDKISKINSGLKRELNDMRDMAIFWENESKESIVQLNESRVIEHNLRKWLGQIETKTSEVTSSHVRVEQEKKTLQGTIQEMGSVMDDLIKEMTYLRSLNKEYRKELAKPKFMSMGAIARREGFVMPNGKENLRKHYLGNAAPTLLKFKSKEEMSHA